MPKKIVIDENEKINLRDVMKEQGKIISTYSKEELRTYLKSIGKNEKSLRKLSRYLYYRSHIYYRLVQFYSNMFDLRCRKVVPRYDLVKTLDGNKMLKEYQNTLKSLDNMNLQDNMIEVITRCFTEDICYAFFFSDDDGSFFYILDPDMCKIDSRYMTGDFGFAIDMSKWSNAAKQEQMLMIGEPLISMYEEYEKTNIKWQHCPDKYAACFKFRTDDWETIIPPFLSLFIGLINLEDLEDVQAIADAQQIYKLIYLPMETLNNADGENQWKITPDTLLEYFYSFMAEALPDYTSAAVIPGEELKVIDFNNNAAEDNNRVSKSQTTILDTSGGGMVLNTSRITTQAGFQAALKCETEFAISTLLPQFNAFTNRMLTQRMGKNHAKVEYFEVSVYTKDEVRKSLLESCQYSYSNKIAYNTFNGISEIETLAMNFLEEDVLKLHEKMKYPLSSSFTQTGDTEPNTGQGAPEKDVDDLLAT